MPTAEDKVHHAGEGVDVVARIGWIAAFVALLALAQAVERIRRARLGPLPNAEPLFY